MKTRNSKSDLNKDSLWTLRETTAGLNKFIDAHPAEVEQEPLARYIDASAKPLDNRKEGQSKFFQGSGDDCK
jgi:hypothetical protein